MKKSKIFLESMLKMLTISKRPDLYLETYKFWSFFMSKNNCYVNLKGGKRNEKSKHKESI